MGRRTRQRGFTLVELLVVIGIIALLISILLPSLNRAREASRRVKCLSNMRQIVMAMQAFASENKGLMPANGTKNVYRLSPSGSSITKVGLPTKDDYASMVNWICYVRAKDPISPSVTTGINAGDPADANITYGGLTRYLGAKFVTAPTPDGQNQVNLMLDSLFRCPSDKLGGRYNETAGGNQTIYRYSYAANKLYMNWGAAQATADTTGPLDAAATAAALPGARFGGQFNGKIASIKGASDRILLICQDTATLDDGNWNPAPYNSIFNAQPSQGADILSSIHDNSKAMTAVRATSGSGASGDTSNSRGNVVMVDGHGEFISRKDSMRQKYTGNPYKDPTPNFDN